MKTGFSAVLKPQLTTPSPYDAVCRTGRPGAAKGSCLAPRIPDETARASGWTETANPFGMSGG